MNTAHMEQALAELQIPPEHQQPWNEQMEVSAEREHGAINHGKYIAKFSISPDCPVSVNSTAVWSYSLKNLFSVDDTLDFIVWNCF